MPYVNSFLKSMGFGGPVPRETRLTEYLDHSTGAEGESQDGTPVDPEQAEQENAAQQYYGEDSVA